MPYKCTGRTVYVQKDGKWKVLKMHQTPEKAQAHLAALEANVPEAGEGAAHERMESPAKEKREKEQY